jgi:tripartite-type tricarboxylate transporter receptor subunit TctC
MGIRAAPLAIGRAFGAPPGVPADRVKLLREAFAKAANDPEFRADATKAKIPVSYIAWEEVQKMFAALLDQPPEVQKEMVKYIKFGGG